MSEETIEWRAVLRHSEFLKDTPSKYIYNIYGEELDEDLIDLPSKLDYKRSEFWEAVASGQLIEKIKSTPIKATYKVLEEHNDDNDNDTDEFDY